jgi:hypothetical protein
MQQGWFSVCETRSTRAVCASGIEFQERFSRPSLATVFSALLQHPHL